MGNDRGHATCPYETEPLLYSFSGVTNLYHVAAGTTAVRLETTWHAPTPPVCKKEQLVLQIPAVRQQDVRLAQLAWASACSQSEDTSSMRSGGCGPQARTHKSILGPRVCRNPSGHGTHGISPAEGTLPAGHRHDSRCMFCPGGRDSGR